MQSNDSSSLVGVLATPLGEISTNVARIAPAMVPDTTESATSTGKVESDSAGSWKVMLSPVLEESPSPRKGGRRKARCPAENVAVNYSPQRDTDRDQNFQESSQGMFSPPLSPGSLKMKNFLQRLERQGLSHD